MCLQHFFSVNLNLFHHYWRLPHIRFWFTMLNDLPHSLKLWMIKFFHALKWKWQRLVILSFYMHLYNKHTWKLWPSCARLTSLHSDPTALHPHTQILTLTCPSFTSSHSDPLPYLLTLRSPSLTSSHWDSPSLTSSHSDPPNSLPHTQIPQPYLLTLRSPCFTSSCSDPPNSLIHTQIPQPYLLTLRFPSLTSHTQISQPHFLTHKACSFISSLSESNKEFKYNLHHFSRMPYSKFQKERNHVECYLLDDWIPLFVSFLFCLYVYMFLKCTIYCKVFGTPKLTQWYYLQN